jgi:hypothetical protein
LIVIAIDRPCGASPAGGGVVGVLAEGGVVAPAELEAVEPLELADGAPAPPPQAVTVSARPAATAYLPCLDGVIFVTHGSLDSGF